MAPAVRFAMLGGFSAAFAFGYWIVDRFWASEGFASSGSFQQLLTTILGSTIPAACLLFLLGTWRRLRIGPHGLVADRLSILQVMLGTALIAGAIQLNCLSSYLSAYAVGREFSNGVVSVDADLRTFASHLPQAVGTTLVFGGILSIALYTAAAASRSWLARGLLIGLLTAAGVSAFVLNQQFASAGAVALWTIALSMPICYGIGLAWVSLSLRLLDAGGWVLKRRLEPIVVQ